MSVKLSLNDNQYPFNGTNHTRVVIRGIVLNNDNKMAFCHVIRDDIFGKSSYIETSGGGKEENESLQQGLIREIDEELGYKIEIISYLGEVEDYYNLIGRKNINHYFLCKIKEKTKVHFESEGDTLIKEILWLSYDEIMSWYSKMNDGVPFLVKQRELPILMEAKKYIDL